VGWTYAQLAALSIAAMFSPGTLTFSTLALVLGERPLRTGAWFRSGGLCAMLAIGIAAAFVLGNVAAPTPSGPRTWVAVLDVIGAVVLVVYGVRWLLRPGASAWMQSGVERMHGVASSSAAAIFGAGALLAIPGAFIPLALKAISETDPSDRQYVVEWVAFTAVAFLPLILAVILLLARRDWTMEKLNAARGWLDVHLGMIVGVLCLLVALSLLRDAIVGLL
jgi:hypothetical protein